MTAVDDPGDFALCKMQGSIFEKLIKEGYDPEQFIKFYMNSSAIEHMDRDFDHMQWTGEYYVTGSVVDEAAEQGISLNQSKPLPDEKKHH